MTSPTRLLGPALACALLACTSACSFDGGAADHEGAAAGDEAVGTDSAELSTTRVYGVVAAVAAAADHDGVAGDECLVLVTPEHRLRPVVLLEPATAAGCTLSAYAPGQALSFTWGDTRRYGRAAGTALVRAALAAPDAAVHTLVGAVTSEATTLAELGAFAALAPADQASALATNAFVRTRVHSRYDFDGASEVSAEAAYQAVRVTQPCENPGTPELLALSKGGFVFGYEAKNSGSCHSGWFSTRHLYARDFTRVGTDEYSE